MARYGNPSYARSGTRRDAAFYESRRTALRAKTAEQADTAASADEASVAFAVAKDSPRSSLDDAALMAFVTDSDRIQPVTVANFLAYLETKYVLTPIP